MDDSVRLEDVTVDLNELYEPNNDVKRLQEIYKLRNLYNTQGCGIKLYNESDGFLLRFLRAGNFDQNKALTLLNNYHVYFQHWPEVFEKMKNPHTVKHIFIAGSYVVLQGKAVDGSAVCISRPGKLENIAFSDYLAAVVITINVLLEDESNQIYGITLIIDKKYITPSSISILRPYFAKKLLDLYQKVLPIRVRSIHFVNDSNFFQSYYSKLSLFLTDSTKKIVTFDETNFTLLHKLVNVDVLPPCYGGTGPDIDSAVKSLKKIIYGDSDD